MKSELMITMGAFLALALRAQLMPLPDMSSSKVPTVRDAEDIVTKHILASPDDGLSATETIVGKLSFALGVDISRFGKKGDRVWQVHRVSFAKTTSIIWVNAETTLIHVVFPEKKLNVEPGNPPKPHSPSAQGAGSR